MRIYHRVLEALNALAGYLSALLMAAMCIVVFCGVFSRYVLGDPWQWTEETARLIFIWVVFTAASVAVRRGIHFRFTLLIDSSGPKVKALLEALANAWVIFFAGILLIKGASFALMNMKQLTPSLVIPWGWVYMAVPISAVLMILYSMEHLRVALQSMRGGSGA